MLPELKSGDIGLSSSDTFLSKAIRFFGKLQTGEACRSHAFSMVGSALCVETLTRVRINDVSKYYKEDIEIWRVPLTHEERDSYAKGMMQVAGDGYGWGKIPLHAMDSISSAIARKPVFFFTRTFGITSFKDCSQLTVWGLHKFTKYTLLDDKHKVVDWRVVSPDYLQDLLAHPHNKAVLIHKQASK